MKQIVSEAIILSRTDYGEADRILRLLTPDHGKVALMAKGVRRVTSKLAGGIELFSVSDITFMEGRGTVGRLISARLRQHYGNIATDLDRTMLGYELIKLLNRVTEDQAEAEYFDILHGAFEALQDLSIPLACIRFWFDAQLLRTSGHSPQLRSDVADSALRPDVMYSFDYDRMAFTAHEQTSAGYGFDAAHIKFLRLAFAGNTARVLANVQGSTQLVADTSPLLRTMITMFLRV